MLGFGHFMDGEDAGSWNFYLFNALNPTYKNRGLRAPWRLRGEFFYFQKGIERCCWLITNPNLRW
jgi:hypothetical protein